MFSEKCTLTQATREEWLKEVIDDGVGYLKVRDEGGNYIVFDNGIFSMKYRKITREVYKSKETIKEIFRKRIQKYQNVEHSGIAYYYSQGTWKKSKVTFEYD